MYVCSKEFSGQVTVPMQAWNTRIVTALLNSAKGDLMLDANGNLTDRITYDPDTFKDLPFNEHKAGNVLALIGYDGWLLTGAGANWILENCSLNSKFDIRKLRAIAA